MAGLDPAIHAPAVPQRNPPRPKQKSTTSNWQHPAD
jgi:hypothetical protein